MEIETQEDIEKETPVPPSGTEQIEGEPTPEQDPLKTELEKVQRKGRSKAEKLLYTKKRVDEQLKELGIEDDQSEPDEDDKPVTVGMLKKLQQQTATKTALQLAEEVTNPTERELLIYHLENTIRSTGNPQQDFELARGLVNAVKNKQIIEESIRKPIARTHASGSGAPAKANKPQDDLTPEEQAFMKPPFNLSREQIIKARPQ